MPVFKKMRLFWFATSLAFLTLSLSCDNSLNPDPPKSTTLEIIQKEPNFSILNRALERANLSSFYNTQTCTLFAPTNAAFNTFFLNSQGNYTTIEDVPVAQLKLLLQYHTVNIAVLTSKNSNVYLNSLAFGPQSTSNSLSLFLKQDGALYNVNGYAKIINPDFVTLNGVLQVIDNVLVLPKIVGLLIVNPNLSSYSTALANPTQPPFPNNYSTILSGVGPFTLFAPSNTAYANFITENGYTATNTVPDAIIIKTSKYQIVTNANLTYENVTNNQSVASFQGNSFTILKNDATSPKTFKILDSKNRTATITIYNIQAMNGIAHILDDKVLDTN